MIDVEIEHGVIELWFDEPNELQVIRSRTDADDLITALMLARDKTWPQEHPLKAGE